MTSAPSTTEQENIMESEHKLGGQRSLTVVSGPLAGYAAGFRQALIAQGYARRTIGDQMSMMAHLSRWLEAGGLDVTALQSAAEIDRFFAERRAGGYRTRVSRGALSGLFGFLSDHEIIGAPAEPATGPVGRLLAEYRLYLRDERGAAPGTIRGFTACATMFLQSAVAPGRQPGEALSGLSAADITRFVARWARSRSHAYSKSMVSALRSLMRFLHVAGYIPRPLDTAVPSVPGWQAVRRPHRVSGREITAILAACDRESARGRRDYAILMLLARLGLRAAEVAAIRLGDIDWRQGVLTVRGKGSALDELPVPADVGAAMADYVRRGRPRTSSRLLFVSVRAPFAGLSPESVGSAVKRACEQAGLTGFGPHRLRHAVACQLQRDGASLEEIGQLLRQRDPRTTARYATVDAAALTALARPCPEGSAR
jgi:integrase/recombinase XerD